MYFCFENKRCIISNLFICVYPEPWKRGRALLGRRARESFVISEATLRHGVKEHANETKFLLRTLSDLRTEGCLTHLKIFARSSPQQEPEEGFAGMKPQWDLPLRPPHWNPKETEIVLNTVNPRISPHAWKSPPSNKPPPKNPFFHGEVF